MIYMDPFAPRIQDEPIPPQIERQNLNVSQDCMEPANRSVSTSIADVSGSGSEFSGEEAVRKA